MRAAFDGATALLRVGSSAAIFAILGVVGGPIGVLLGALVGAALGALHAAALISSRCYSAGPKGWFLLLVDNTWALTNTTLGSLFLAFNFFGRNNPLDPQRCEGRSSLVLRDKTLKNYATTIGPVEAGTSDALDTHEQVHVLQARIFGPLFYPLVAVSYVIVTIFPYWLLFHDFEKHPIRGIAGYFQVGVYRHSWHEEWAYRT